MMIWPTYGVGMPGPHAVPDVQLQTVHGRAQFTITSFAVGSFGLQQRRLPLRTRHFRLLFGLAPLSGTTRGGRGAISRKPGGSMKRWRSRPGWSVDGILGAPDAPDTPATNRRAGMKGRNRCPPIISA